MYILSSPYEILVNLMKDLKLSVHTSMELTVMYFSGVISLLYHILVALLVGFGQENMDPYCSLRTKSEVFSQLYLDSVLTKQSQKKNCFKMVFIFHLKKLIESGKFSRILTKKPAKFQCLWYHLTHLNLKM